jgi:hypothetical protein
MSTNNAGLSDEVAVDLDLGPAANAVPAHPSSVDGHPAWVKYATALGLHPDVAAGMTIVELSATAARIGGR